MRKLRNTALLLLTFITMPLAAQGIIDVHSHIITQDYMQAIRLRHAGLDERFPLPT